MKVVIEDKNIKGIPVLDVFNIDSTKKDPIIIILHGFSCHKEQHIKEAYKFVRSGFYVTLFDAYLHGENSSDDFNKLSYFEQIPQGDLIVQETIKYINTLIAEYYNNPMVAPNRIGLIGFSMGGSIIYKYLSQETKPNVRAAIPVIATPKIGDSFKEIFKNDSQAQRYFDDFNKISLMENESYNKLLQLRNFPLLIMSSEDDPIIPIKFVRSSFKDISKNYDNLEKIQMIEYKGIKHEATEDMIEKACIWFKQYLFEV